MTTYTFRVRHDIIITSEALKSTGYRVMQTENGTWKMTNDNGGAIDGSHDERGAWQWAAYSWWVRNGGENNGELPEVVE